MNLEQIFFKPLIVGASVSADHFTASPGKRLALRYTKKENIRTIATGGQPGVSILSELTPKLLDDRSIVVGIDLFFWDSFRVNTSDSVEAMKNLAKMTQENKIHIVIGEVPVIMPTRQSQALFINSKIKELCHTHSFCKLVPLNHILRKTLMDGYITQAGKKYTLDKLLPDGLHVSEVASEYLADQIASLFSDI